MMKKFFTLILPFVTLCATGFAQSFQVGVRVGANMTDFALPKLSFEEGVVAGADARVGFETALMARFNLTRHLHLQAEFEFSRSSYRLRYVEDAAEQRVKLHAHRVELPLLLGVNLGPVRLFGGTFIRIVHSEKSSAPSVVKVKFNDSDVGYMGGLGVNIRKFFIEARVTGYPKRSTSHSVESYGVSREVEVKRHIRYSLSTGVFF